MSRARRNSTLATAAVVAVLTAVTSAHVPLRPPGSIYVGIRLEVGGAPFAAKGTGECNYAADASIRQMPGQMWSVRQRDCRAGRELHLVAVEAGRRDVHPLRDVRRKDASRQHDPGRSCRRQTWFWLGEHLDAREGRAVLHRRRRRHRRQGDGNALVLGLHHGLGFGLRDFRRLRLQADACPMPSLRKA